MTVNSKGDVLPDPIGQPRFHCQTAWRSNKDLVAYCASTDHIRTHGIWRRHVDGFRFIRAARALTRA